MLFYLYCIDNLVKIGLYVGVTNAPLTRWATHQNIASKGKEAFPHHFQAIHSAINKYGVSNFRFEVIQIFDNEDACYQAEEDLISYLRSMNIKLYNIAGGGKGTGSGPNHPMFGKELPEEWKQNLAEAVKISANKPEVREKHRQNMINRNWVGENHPMYGQTHTVDARSRIGKAATGRPKSQETRDKISKAHTGKIVTQETRDKMSIANKGKWDGEKNPNFGGKCQTEEVRKKMSDSKKGKPSQLRGLNKEQVFEILDYLATGIAVRTLARNLDITRDVIRNIQKEKCYQDWIKEWKHNKQ